ncbi:NAD(P)-dependent oxidoreductase [Planococcus salinus]|uniref:SDR family oxidoreductase n=1 Tax=Planococcus salinus TaxID=1848460 RepID=A0A3M8P686_9BACL|nr:SDR family oxidoreductase [Planococcus salinus]RNF39206.1 SDR family oxidoreductase [Planococcus salinus]
MRIAVFGATGRVGSEILRLALEDGHHVKALVRRRKLDEHPNLEMIVGDVKNLADVAATVAGADAVFSAIGTDRTTTLTEAMPLIIASMHANNVRRIITIGTAGILNSRLTPGLLRYRGGDSKRKLTFAAEQHEAVYRLLEETELDWTIVCPTYLPDGEARGDYRIEKDFLPEGGKEITVGDTAHFAYRQLKETEFVRNRAGIAY